jgi:acyl carrier protein
MNLKEELIQLVSTSFNKDIDKVRSATNWTQLGLDSLDTVELIMQIEEKFSIIIEEEETSTLVDMESMISLIESKLQGK